MGTPEDQAQGTEATVDTDKVTAALRDAAQEDLAAEGTTQPPVPPEADVPAQVAEETSNQEPPATADQQMQDAVDSFTNIDPATLSPELQAIYRNMQSHFTKATQEVAPFRELASEYGVSAEEMRQAVDFVGRIQSDPAYTQQVYSTLGEYLQSIGLRSPQAAPAAAADNEPDPYDDGGFDPAVDSPADTQGREVGTALEQRLAMLENELATQQQTMYMRDLATTIKQQEFAVRESRPDWKDGDIQRVYELAPSYDGDLTKAADAYDAWRTDILQGYLEGKAAAPSNGTPAAASTGTEAPTPPATIRDASMRAEEALTQALGD